MASARRPPLHRLQRREALRSECHRRFMGWHARHQAACEDARRYPAQSFEYEECIRLIARASRAMKIYAHRHATLFGVAYAQVWSNGAQR